MTWLKTGAAALLTTALTLGTTTAQADSYCFQKECAYALEVSVLLGGVAAVVGGTVSIFDDEPSNVWYRLGYGFGVLNMLAGGVFAVVGGSLDEEDEDRSTFITLGAAQAGLGVFGVFMGVLAEGHYDATERASGRASLTPRVVPLVDPSSGMPRGAMVSATF
ncbi:MAG: hypothetical protein DRI90_15045 [Deltaproteobacteria bacterium]|nr:MAG: hypothetical protein DRI90_15045 [Deltaproteobacteria bacterium]